MKALIWIVLALIWGSTWFFIKIGLKDLPPLTFSSARFMIATAVIIAWVQYKKIPWPQYASGWKLLALTGILQFTINYSTVFWAEVYISSGLAAVLQATIPAFGLLLAWIFLPTEKITPLKIIAIALGIVGVAIIFVDQLAVNDIWAFAGSVAIVFGAYTAAQSSVLIKSRASEMHPLTILAGQMLFGIPPVIVYALAYEGNPLNHNWSSSAILCVIYLALIGTITAFWLYYWLLQRIESTNAMMISLVTPLLAVLIGYFFLGEVLPQGTFFGGILILSGILLIIYRKKAAQPQLVK